MKDLEPSAVLDPLFWIYVNVFNFTYKRINRSSRHREIDLCIKECLGSEKKKSASFEIPREINSGLMLLTHNPLDKASN